MLPLLLLTSAFVLLPWAGAGRIIGGCVAKPHSRPYMAYLKIQNGSQSYSCGGFLIRPDTVLSAAHCVAMKGAVRVTVILGAHNISAQEQSQQEIPVGQWVIHPQYCPDNFKNDIVLLKLKQRAMINKNVQCISIAKENERVEEGAECSVSGWGRISTRWDMTSDVLREVELKVQNEQICEQVFHNYQRQSMICVGDEYSKKATYKGDSGGPLVCNKKAHGIVSYGPQGNVFPKVFTRISYFEPWIRKQLRRFALQDTPGSPFSE
ncbi:cathepsin G-like [Haemorhous mexicanus]|uniref:cathepsin G-like n=1 Tax=Haemorhous mexicanus TaxID=30427 RepID=UPI0028BE4E7A|nr:cathepsin G-like [Haemorhous mexicanus]